MTEVQIVDAIKSRGLRVTPVGTAGAVRVHGADVDVVAASIFAIDFKDLTIKPLRDNRRRKLHLES
jgi:hypothetical protein